MLTVRLPDVTLRASADDAAAAVGSLTLNQQVALAAWARGADGYTWWLLASGGWARGDAFVNEANPTLPDDCWTLPPANQTSVPALEGTASAPAAQVAPLPAGSCALTVRVTNANVRAVPDTSQSVVEQLPAGSQVQAIGWASGAEGFTWWQLASGGWARGDVFDSQALAQACRDLPRISP